MQTEGAVAGTGSPIAQAADPTGSRRRETGATSARSLLLTVLGEFARLRGVPIWTATLVSALGALGVEEKAARQALARTAAEGVLEAGRVGRRTRWTLSAPGERLLADGAGRIYGFMREQPRWDGRWIVLAVTVPETRRQLRHRLRTRLMWAGLGSPAPGLWVVPDPSRLDEVVGIVEDLGIGDSAMCWVGPVALVGDPASIVRAAWPLADVEAAYHEFVARFSGRSVAGRGLAGLQAAFVAQVELVQAWRRFPFLDPALPAELLDRDWPGPRAAAVFLRQHQAWHRRAQAHWQRLCGDAEG